MISFPAGIVITETERRALLHIETDAEEWLRQDLVKKARRLGNVLINQWRPRLFADPAVINLPADGDALVRLITLRPEFKTRAQVDADFGRLPSRHNIDKFAGQDRTGPTVTLFQEGITITDADRDCILAYVQDLEDWILGALMGRINQGKKKMIRQYFPVLVADPNVTTFRASEDELVQTIITRADYRTLPAQLEETRSRLR